MNEFRYLPVLLTLMCLFGGWCWKDARAAAAATHRGCICVSKQLCLDEETYGEGQLDIRYIVKFTAGACGNYFEICCVNPVESVPAEPPQTPPRIECGRRNPSGLNYRITGDSSTAEFGELPWTAILLRKESNGKSFYKCGGSLIHPQVVLTAAHCVSASLDASTEWTVRLGEWNTKETDEPMPHQDREVIEVVVHEEFNAASLKNDVALLVLNDAVDVRVNVGFVCLPAAGVQLNGLLCIASGWGKDAFKKGRHSSILKKVELPLIPRQSCLESLRNTRLGKHFNLHQSFLCAGGEGGRDTCKGDGGGPLVCPLPSGRYFLAGVVSWGIGCGEDGTPGVYANVALYRDWVDKQLGARSFDTGSYKYE